MLAKLEDVGPYLTVCYYYPGEIEIDVKSFWNRKSDPPKIEKNEKD